jgi:glycosyltransferase involved in cell wall biosynthesis
VVFPYPQAFGYFPDIHEYVTLLRERGIDAYYVGTQPDQNAPETPPHVMHPPWDTRGRRVFLDYVNTQVAAIAPDIVHVFHFRGCGLLPLMARGVGCRWLVDVRTVHVETQDYRTKPSFWWRDRLTWLETQTYDQILALTQTIQRRLRPTVRPVTLVPLGASAGKLRPANKAQLRAQTRDKLQIPEETPVLLYAGSLSPTRQLDRIVAGFARVQADHPEALLLMVGGQPGFTTQSDPQIAPLSGLARELGIAANVLFTGRVPYTEMPAYFAAADVGVSYMPRGTAHQHQPPTKLIEYMMAGLVATSNDIPAIADLVADDVHGVLFGESPAEIAAGLSRALALLRPAHRSRHAQLTKRAYEAVRGRDWRQIVDEHLLPVYERMLG